MAQVTPPTGKNYTDMFDYNSLNDENILYAENEYIKLGINLALGGAVTYLAEHGKPNMINSFDWGRQVQMSFYSYPVPYQPEGADMVEAWREIGWNPIQSGDVGRNRSQVLDWYSKDGEIYVKCVPMHWPLDNYPGECTFEVWYRLEGCCVNATARLNNARPDTTQYPARRQELPAVYTNGEWYRGVSYVGKKPFTGDALTELVSKDDGRGYPWLQFYPTENWSALGERGNPLPYLAKVPVILTQGYVELDKDAYGGVPLMTFRGFRKKAFAYIEKRWEVEYVEQLGRGFRFVGEDCTVTALRDGYLGLFTIWNVYDYPNS